MKLSVKWMVGTCVLAVVMGLTALLFGARHANRTPPSLPTGPATIAPVPEVTRLRAQADPELGQQPIQQIETEIGRNPSFRNDVLFLIVATARDRCMPGHAGELARMANRAQLPILVGVSQVTEADPALDKAIYHYVQTVANQVVCGQAFELRDQPSVEIDTYAERFPDSYFTPSHQVAAPTEYRGRPLATRAQQACQTVAYTVLPLSTPDWRCDAGRSGARRRIVDACEATRQQLGATDNEELTEALGQALAQPVSDIVATVPQQCR